METKHTPGPWRVAGSTGEGRMVETCPQYENGRTFDIAEVYGIENAELIARAPDLLAEVERLEAVNKELADALERIANEEMPHAKARMTATSVLGRIKK